MSSQRKEWLRNMIAKLTKNELYRIEKVMDNTRDSMLQGMVQYVRLCENNNVPVEYKKLIHDEIKNIVSSWDELNSICSKLEGMRLGEDEKTEPN